MPPWMGSVTHASYISMNHDCCGVGRSVEKQGNEERTVMTNVLKDVAEVAEELSDVYRDLHQNPELSGAEVRTARIIAEFLTTMGWAVESGIGGTGVVGILRNGSGATVMLRADMDGLPVLEATGLDYASTAHGTSPSGADVPVMHACGHDMHVTCLLGAARLFATHRSAWSGTVVLVFQPAEETGAGARDMVADGLFDRVPRPDVVLGQHVAPFPAGALGVHAGPAFAGSDSFAVTLYGRSGHGSRPETTVDPVVLAAATILRLQTLVSREIGGNETGVLTVGQVHSGTKNNIIAADATLGISMRTADRAVRKRLIAGMTRVINAEAEASGAPTPPQINAEEYFPVVVNDTDATARVRAAFTSHLGGAVDPGAVTGSEDVGTFATAAGAPLVYWLLGGTDPQTYATAVQNGSVAATIPSNHSPLFAPVIRPTLDAGISALVVAALEWVGTTAAESVQPTVR